MTTMQLLKPLLDGLSQSHPGFSSSDLEKAFAAAEKAHAGQLRKSGEEYITHPVAVAQILIDLGMDLPTIMAALHTQLNRLNLSLAMKLLHLSMGLPN